jgi:hypothetical protein
MPHQRTNWDVKVKVLVHWSAAWRVIGLFSHNEVWEASAENGDKASVTLQDDLFGPQPKKVWKAAPEEDFVP